MDDVISVDFVSVDELRSDICYVPGTHSYQQIPVRTLCTDILLDFLKCSERTDICAQLCNFSCDVIGGDTVDILFARRVDRRQDDVVGSAERFRKSREKGLRARVGVGLEDDPEFSVPVKE